MLKDSDTQLNTAGIRRRDFIVASGAAVSQIGLEKIFTVQAMQFGEQDGTCLSLVWLKALLNDESLAPIVEIIYGAFNEQIFGMATWVLLPQ